MSHRMMSLWRLARLALRGLRGLALRGLLGRRVLRGRLVRRVLIRLCPARLGLQGQRGQPVLLVRRVPLALQGRLVALG